MNKEGRRYNSKDNNNAFNGTGSNNPIIVQMYSDRKGKDPNTHC